MKKIFLSSILLLSCVIKAENTTDNALPEAITFENSVCQEAKSDNISTENIASEKVSKTIKNNIISISENCDSIVLTFKINKNKNCTDAQAWANTISAVSDLISLAESTNNNSEEEITKVLNTSYDFLKNCSKSAGCTGDYSINLNIPQDFAKSIFPGA